MQDEDPTVYGLFWNQVLTQKLRFPVAQAPVQLTTTFPSSLVLLSCCARCVQIAADPLSKKYRMWSSNEVWVVSRTWGLGHRNFAPDFVPNSWVDQRSPLCFPVSYTSGHSVLSVGDRTHWVQRQATAEPHTYVTYRLHVLICQRFYLFVFRERRGEGEREGEKHWCEGERDIDQSPLICTSQTCNSGLGPGQWTRWPFAFAGRCLSSWAALARASGGTF